MSQDSALMAARFLEPANYAHARERSEAAVKWARKAYGPLAIQEHIELLPWDCWLYLYDTYGDLKQQIDQIWSNEEVSHDST